MPCSGGEVAAQQIGHLLICRVGHGGLYPHTRAAKNAADEAAPNTTYVGDITYLPLATGENLHLATVIDCCSRRVAGWAIADHLRTELAEGRA